jgi:hypothetical protein
MIKPGYAVISSAEGLWVTDRSDLGPSQTTNDGVFYIAEEGTETATNSSDHITSILKSNIERILKAEK